MTVKFVSHRGESESAPENTLESFALAWARGSRCIEGDFHLTRDNAIVCMHDDCARRTCGVDLPLAAMTLAEIKELDAGIWKGEQWKYTRVPTLSEVLKIMPDYGEIFLELKSVGPILDYLPDVFAAAGHPAEHISFIAFDAETISTVKKRFPAHRAYWLSGSRLGASADGAGAEYTPESFVAQLRKLGVDGVDINYKHVTKEYVDALHAAGLEFHVWTVDDAQCARRMIACGVDSITSNRAYALQREIY